MSNHGAAYREAPTQLTHVLLMLLLLSPACNSVGIRQSRQLIIKPPTLLTSSASVKTNLSADALAALNVTASVLDAHNITRKAGDEAANKIINPTTNSQIFLNYGLALTAAIYSLIGIGYFYGPYSVDAFLAKQRSEHRLEYLRQRLENEDNADEEVDYGDYVEEEVWAFRDPYYQQATGYSGPRDQYGSNSDHDPGHGSQYHHQERLQHVSQPDQVYQQAESGYLQHPHVAVGQVTKRHGVAYTTKERVRGNFKANEDTLESHRRNSLNTGDAHFNQKIEQLRSMLQMENENCREWIRCLQKRRKHQLMARNDVSNRIEAVCWHHQKTCPVKPNQSVSAHERHWSTQQPISYRPGDDVNKSKPESQNDNTRTQ